jgi:hypothetical protein
MLKYILTFFLFLFVSSSYSQQNNYPQQNNNYQVLSLKFSLKYQITQSSFIEIPDIPNHRLGTAIGTGVALFNDSLSVPVKSYFIYDYVDGNGTFTDYYVFTFNNGSSFTVQAQGVAQGSGPNGGNPLFQANTYVTAGTGDFVNFKAVGTMSGNRNSMVENSALVKLSFDMK